MSIASYEINYKSIYLLFVLNLLNLEDNEKKAKIISDMLSRHVRNEISTEQIIDRLNSEIDFQHQYIKPKKSIDEVAKILYDNKENIKPSYGIEFGFVNNLYDISQTDIPHDLPFHARIGIGRHSTGFVLEERILLEDSFMFLAETFFYWKRYKAYAEKISSRNQSLDQNLYRKLTDIKSNIILKSKRGLTSFYSFLEAFTNSIGYDFMIKNENELTELQIARLLGYQKANRKGYLNLGSKFQEFSKIIRNREHPLLEIKTDNIPKCYKDLFSTVTPLRDSLMHFGPEKEPIFKKPEEWVENLKEASKIIIRVARNFWKLCYPDKPFPSYLLYLDYNELVKYSKTVVDNNISFISNIKIKKTKSPKKIPTSKRNKSGKKKKS